MRVKINPCFNPKSYREVIVNCGLSTASDSNRIQTDCRWSILQAVLLIFSRKAAEQRLRPYAPPGPLRTALCKAPWYFVKFTSWSVRISVLIGFRDRVTWNSRPSEIRGQTEKFIDWPRKYYAAAIKVQPFLIQTAFFPLDKPTLKK